MAVNIEFMDIDENLKNLIIGPYESVQVTRQLLRDSNDNELAAYDSEVGLWWVEPPGMKYGYYSDFIVSGE